MYAKEMCRNCYNYTHVNPKKRLQAVLKWKKKNPEYFRNYMRKRNKIKEENFRKK